MWLARTFFRTLHLETEEPSLAALGVIGAPESNPSPFFRSFAGAKEPLAFFAIR
jgi:hypothetical protein